MRDPIRIAGQEIRPGEQLSFDVPIVDLSTRTPMTMPVQVIHGIEEGPRLFISAALHGDEINGVEIVQRVMADPALAALHGTLIAVPVVNVFGFVAQQRYLPDRRDLNRSFPGSARGSLAARLAHLFLSEIVGNATHGIDLHTGAIHRTNYPQVRANLDQPETEKLARAFGAPVIINSGFREGSLRESAAKWRVPVLVYEVGEALRHDEPGIAIGVRGVYNVMEALGMLPARREAEPAPEPLIARSSTWVRAPRSGVLREPVTIGSVVEKGATLGYIADPFGEERVEVKARGEGLVIGLTYLPLVYEGDALFHLVRTVGEQVNATELEVPAGGLGPDAEEADEALTYG
ncbi:MAG: succinylglutamate desuccinylase/aspartoacylase family protein [Alphaproteobacteria bacterium]